MIDWILSNKFWFSVIPTFLIMAVFTVLQIKIRKRLSWQQWLVLIALWFMLSAGLYFEFWRLGIILAAQKALQ